MSINKKNLAIFHNLPDGGAYRVFNNLNIFLRKKYNLDIYEVQNKKPKNIISYFIYVNFVLKNKHKELAKIINSKKYKIILIHHDYLTKSPYILRYLNNTTIYICHEEPREFYIDKKYFSSNLKNKIINFLRLPLKKVDLINTTNAKIILTNSIYSKNKLEKIYKKNIEILPIGVNTKIFNKQNIKKKKFYLTVGSTSIFKGIDFIIRSLNCLPRKFKYPLVIIGNKGRNHKYIINLSKKYNVKIILIHNIKDEKLARLYNQAQLTLMAAHNEPLGLSTIESISCGTKVIAINEGGYKEIITNNNIGTLIERDPIKFSKEILKNLNTKINIKDIKKFQYSWSWKNTENYLFNLLEECHQCTSPSFADHI